MWSGESCLRIVTGLINKVYETDSGQCYSDCIIEGEKGYKMRRQSHIQFRDRYCRDSSEDTWKKVGKDPEDTHGANEFEY